MKCCILFLSIIFLLAAPVASFSQQGTYYNPRDDQYKLLGLKRALDAYNIQKAEYRPTESAVRQRPCFKV